MKYMTFNSSCSYAGVANMLAQYGVDTDDRAIAAGMKLPFLFARENGTYLAGPMLQSAEWFNLYLHSIGYTLKEAWAKRGEVPAILQQEKTAMLGLRVSPRNKHAVVYIGCEGGKLVFLNNKWRHTEEPERLLLSGQELLERLEERVMIATIAPAPVERADFRPLYEQSVRVLEELKRDIKNFCRAEQTPQAIRGAMDAMFRAILLDGITMLELCGRTGLAEKLRGVQAELMAVAREGKAAALSDVISVAALLEAIDEYSAWIRGQSG